MSKVDYSIIGKRFGKLIVINLEYKDNNTTYWKCLCDCGKETTVQRTCLVGKSTSSCGCYKIQRIRETCGLRPYESLFNKLHKESEQRNIKNDLSYEDFLEFTKIDKCHYCDKSIEWVPYNYCRNEANNGGHNLDRKNNYLGYSIENCVVCCKTCNRRKSNIFTYEGYKQLTNLIKELNGKVEFFC
jgi:hypothetical protein